MRISDKQLRPIADRVAQTPTKPSSPHSAASMDESSDSAMRGDSTQVSGIHTWSLRRWLSCTTSPRSTATSSRARNRSPEAARRSACKIGLRLSAGVTFCSRRAKAGSPATSSAAETHPSAKISPPLP